jgi:hypothetical protein
MRTRPAVLAALVVCAAVLLPSAARAGGVEITGFAGYTFPFYEQTFAYDPGPVNVPIPGVSIDQGGEFGLKATGGLAYGGALAFYPSATFGFELRVDRGEFNVETQASTYDVTVTLPSPLQPVATTLTLDEGEGTISAPLPLSLNLKVRGAGATHAYASGGVSRLGGLDFSLRQPIAIGVTAVNLDTSNLEVATVEVQAVAKDTASSWGGNLGLGFQIGLGERGGLVLEARGFYFPKRTVEWESLNVSGLPALQQELLSRTLQNLPPVEFEPWWVQATIGISFRF